MFFFPQLNKMKVMDRSRTLPGKIGCEADVNLKIKQKRQVINWRLSYKHIN